VDDAASVGSFEQKFIAHQLKGCRKRNQTNEMNDLGQGRNQ
jgi:hypothetical protein